MTTTVGRWNSHPIRERALPEGLVWKDEPPNPDHRVRLAFAERDGHKYRRVTFIDGTRIYAELEFVTRPAHRG